MKGQFHLSPWKNTVPGRPTWNRLPHEAESLWRPKQTGSRCDKLLGILLQWFQWGWEMVPMRLVSSALRFRDFSDSGFLWLCNWCEDKFIRKNLLSLTLLYGKPNIPVFDVTGNQIPFLSIHLRMKVIGSILKSPTIPDGSQNNWDLLPYILTITFLSFGKFVNYHWHTPHSEFICCPVLSPAADAGSLCCLLSHQNQK